MHVTYVNKNKNLSDNNLDERTHSTYPWDDTPLPEPIHLSNNRNNTDTATDTVLQDSKKVPIEVQKIQNNFNDIRRNSRSRSQSREPSPVEPEERFESKSNILSVPALKPVVQPSLPVGDSLNMFWLKKSELPCICTDLRTGEVCERNEQLCQIEEKLILLF